MCMCVCVSRIMNNFHGIERISSVNCDDRWRWMQRHSKPELNFSWSSTFGRSTVIRLHAFHLSCQNFWFILNISFVCTDSVLRFNGHTVVRQWHSNSSSLFFRCFFVCFVECRKSCCLNWKALHIWNNRIWTETSHKSGWYFACIGKIFISIHCGLRLCYPFRSSWKYIKSRLKLYHCTFT